MIRVDNSYELRVLKRVSLLQLLRRHQHACRGGGAPEIFGNGRTKNSFNVSNLYNASDDCNGSAHSNSTFDYNFYNNKSL